MLRMSYNLYSDSPETFLIGHSHITTDPVIRHAMPTCIVDGEVWLSKAIELFACGTNKHVPHEQCMVGTGADDTNLVATGFDPVDKSIEHVEVIEGIEIVNRPFSVHNERMFIHLIVRRTFAPPNILLRGRLPYHTFVFGRPSCLCPYKPSLLRHGRVENAPPLPDIVARAPEETICVPGSYLSACSYSSAGERLW